MSDAVIYVDGPKKGECALFKRVPERVFQPVKSDDLLLMYEYEVDRDNPIADTASGHPTFEASQDGMYVLAWLSRDGAKWLHRDFGPGRIEEQRVREEKEKPTDEINLALFLEDLKHLTDKYGAHLQLDGHDYEARWCVGFAEEYI